MDFALLQIFAAVAEEGGITPAARRLNRVQSNVTTRLKQLERSLGVALFVRERGRLHLSPAGEAFLGYASRILALADEARSAVSGAEPAGVLRLGTLESTAASRLPTLLARYHRKYPEVRVELETGTTDDLVDAVLGRRLEAAFVADRSGDRDLESAPAFEERLVLLTPRSHPEVARPRDVRCETVVCFPAGCAYRRRLRAWLARDEVTPRRTLELGSYHAIVACVASGAGIAFAPRSVLDTVRDLEGVSVHPLAGRAGTTTTSLVRRAGPSSGALAALGAELPRRR